MLRQLFKHFQRLWPFLLIAGLIIRLKMKSKTDRISENFDYSEFNAPDDPKVRKNIAALVLNVLQPLRNAIQKPIVITSGYRNPEKNKEVKGVPNSKHLTGQAADFVVSGDLSDTFNTILDLGLSFDELILYRAGARSKSGHLHLAYIDPKKNRKKVIITDPNYER